MKNTVAFACIILVMVIGFGLVSMFISHQIQTMREQAVEQGQTVIISQGVDPTGFYEWEIGYGAADFEKVI